MAARRQHLLRYQHTAAIRAKLRRRYDKPAIVNRHLYARRDVLKAMDLTAWLRICHLLSLWSVLHPP
jgi:hypothetical protein